MRGAGAGMRILMLAESISPIVGGVERIVESLSIGLARRGHEVAIATLSQPGAEPPDLPGVDIHLLGSAVNRLPRLGSDPERHHAPPLPDPETVLGLRRVVREMRPDVVHGHNWLVHSYLPLQPSSDAALVLSMHDYGLICATKRFLHLGNVVCSGPAPAKCVRCATNYYGKVQGPGIALATRASSSRLRRRADMLLPVSTAVRDLCGVSGDDVEVVPNFLGEMPESSDVDEALLAALPDEPFILYFGDVTIDKGGHHLVAAYERLDSPPPLVMVGRNYLDEIEGTPGVVTAGKLPHAAAIAALRRALFVVTPSILPETFGLVALEAAAAGKPTVVSDIGGLKDVVVDGETGILVPPGDRDQLRAAMERMLDDEGLRERMGTAARVRAGEFAEDAVIPMFEAAYERAIESRRAER